MEYGGFLFKDKVLSFLYQNGKKQEVVSMESIAEQWLRNVRLRVKESTYVKYNNIVRNHIVPVMGQLPVGNLTTTVLESFIEEKLKNGRKDTGEELSVKSVKDIVAVVKGICSFATSQNMEIPCHFDQVRIRMRNPEIQVMDRLTQMDLERFLMEDDNLKKTGILLSLYMGLRLGEICALQVECIELETGILHVRNTMQRIQSLDQNEQKKTKVIVTEAKSLSSIRDIPIPVFLQKRLDMIKDLPKNAYFLTGRPDAYIEPRTMENTFKRYLNLCGISSMNYHVLRHTFATRCVEAGVDAKTLSEILGHSNVNITLNRYVHSSMEQKRKSMEMVKIGTA